ncbi:MAG: RNA polymerase sigma factor (sigma-70 family) [Candidatus Paceibacteria bacterium]|jgi:RNA polymerase sigma factor (sigma-70 family)
MDTPDEALIRRAQSGDEEALNELFNANYEDLRRFVRKRLGPGLRRQVDDSEDILHSAMRGALKSLPDFKPDGDEAWLRWMGTIIVNKIASKARHWRAQKRGEGQIPVGGTEGLGMLGQEDDEERSPADQASAKEQQDRLYEALDCLPEARRDLLVKYHITKLNLAELATELDCSEEAVRQRVLRAEQALESELKRQEQP